jgi:hypothetical protein
MRGITKKVTKKNGVMTRAVSRVKASSLNDGTVGDGL